MSEYQVKDFTGSMFINSNKKSENHPDFNGSIRIEGKDYWLSGWRKQGRSGEWTSLAFKLKDGAAPPFRKDDTPPAGTRSLDDSDAPF